MQAENLRKKDVDRLEKAFKKIKKGNPEATLQISLMQQFKKKDCLFKEKCKLNKGVA